MSMLDKGLIDRGFEPQQCPYIREGNERMCYYAMKQNVKKGKSEGDVVR